MKKGQKTNYERPIEISLKGSNPYIISNYLNELSSAADTETISSFISLIQQKVNIRLEEIKTRKVLLLSVAKQDRLSLIERIKIEDAQKINEINDQIIRLRIKVKGDRLNMMQALMDSAIIAKNLGVIENNFLNTKIRESEALNLSLSIANEKGLPEWYLYGEKALLEEVNILKNRINDDIYVSEIVDLKAKLSEIEYNHRLKTLEARKNDSPFIAEINALNIEAIKLKSSKPNLIGINTAQLNQGAYPSGTPIKPKKRLIVAVAFITGFILSIFLVFIMNVFRSEDDKATV